MAQVKRKSVVIQFFFNVYGIMVQRWFHHFGVLSCHHKHQLNLAADITLLKYFKIKYVKCNNLKIFLWLIPSNFLFILCEIQTTFLMTQQKLYNVFIENGRNSNLINKIQTYTPRTSLKYR